MEEIIAAIPITEPSKNVSSQEFQDMLTSWFEKKGILSELRTNLRYKMINVLKNTAIGRDITRKVSTGSINLTKQAINLIVAEFLLKNNCDYSLSLFNTEAGLSSTFSDDIVNEVNKIILQFDKENILNILELIGVHKTSDLCDEILSIYYKSKENNSLLSALILVLSKCLPKTVDFKRKTDIDLSKEIEFIKKVGSILISLNIPYTNIMPTIESIKCLYKTEIQNIEDNYTKLISKLKNHALLKEKQSLEQFKEIKKKNEMLELTIAQLNHIQNELKIQLKRSIKDKLAKEKELTKVQSDLKESKTELEPHLKKEANTECSKNHCEGSCKDNCKLVFNLQNEKEELIKKNMNYLEEINDWKNRYQSLLLDFTSFHQKISSLNFKGTEEIPSSLLNLNLIDDIKHINEKVNCELTDSPETSTDEIIRDARKRLKCLEDETLEIEDKYKKSHTKNKCKLL